MIFISSDPLPPIGINGTTKRVKDNLESFFVHIDGVQDGEFTKRIYESYTDGPCVNREIKKLLCHGHFLGGELPMGARHQSCS